MTKKMVSLLFLLLALFTFCGFPQKVLAGGSCLEAQEREVALTFDDGPHAKYTPMILDMLKKYDAKATFFVIGNRIEAHQEIVKRMAAEGHEIGNHTFTHRELTGSQSRIIANELDCANTAIQEATGETPVLMRPPTGNRDKRVDALAAGRGMSVVLWNIDTLDWKYLDAARTYNQVMKRVKPGSIILMHDFYAATADATERILKSLTEQGYTFVTVRDLLGDSLRPGEVYRAEMAEVK